MCTYIHINNNTATVYNTHYNVHEYKNNLGMEMDEQLTSGGWVD